MTEMIKGLGRGNLYSGKTREECNQNQGFFNKLIKGNEIKLFDKADTNGDNILSAEEICNQRDNYTKRSINGSFLATAGGVLTTGGILNYFFQRGKISNAGTMIASIGVGVALITNQVIHGKKMNKEKEITANYREQYLEPKIDIQDAQNVETEEKVDVELNEVA